MIDAVLWMNTIRENSSELYQKRIPVATKENMQEVGNAIMDYEPAKKEYLDGFVGIISFQRSSNYRFVNKLKVLKKGSKTYGTDIQEYYINPTTAVTFDGSNTSDMLKVTKPDVKTIYHRLNRQDKYPVSISDAQLKTSFTGDAAYSHFAEVVFVAMYSGDEMDEFMLMKNLVSESIVDKKIVTRTVQFDGEEKDCKDLIKMLRTLSNNFELPSNAYNGYNELNAEAIAAGTITPCTTWCPRERQVLLIRSDVDASTDVEVLAKAMQMEKTDFLARKIVVDNFGDADTLCFLCDESAFQVYDDLYTLRNFDNGSNLTSNYWLHHWQTISLSLFANGVAIKQAAATETAA